MCPVERGVGATSRVHDATGPLRGTRRHDVGLVNCLALEVGMLRVISPLTDREEQVISLAMDCAFAVHREIGPGFREKIYRTAYSLELNARGIQFECEKKIDVRYKEWTIPGQRVDLVVEGLVIVEIKAVSKLLLL